MSLVSNLFLLFVAVSVLVYYIVPHKFQWLVLLCFSYIYYLAGGVRYVGFILFSTLVTWGIALAVEKAEAGGSHKSARNFLVLGLILNFGMLGVIKYTNFMIENLNALFHMNLRGMEILLPLGISFYTFQSSGCGEESCKICIVCFFLSTDSAGTNRKIQSFGTSAL